MLDEEIIELKLKFDRIYDRKKNRLIRSYQDIAKKFDGEIMELKLKFDRIYDWKKESFHSLP